MKLLDEGQFSVAYLTDDGLVRRYPRHPFGANKLRREAELLAVIADDLPLPVSRPVEVALDRPLGNAFVSHRYIPGDTITRDLPQDHRDHVIERVTAFLDVLHAIDLDRVPAIVPRYAGGYAAEVRRLVETHLLPRMGAVGRRRAHAELEALDNITPRPSVLCHADIGGNVVFDFDTGTVGVIDFGEAMVDDPVYDAASLSVLGDDFVRDAALRDDARAVRATFSLQDALGGAAQEDWGYVDEVLREYEA